MNQTASKEDPSSKRKKKSFVASKLGCDHCKKQSRRKCDEQLPECGSCKKKNIRCSYLDAPQEFLDRIRRAHSIIADHRLHRQNAKAPDATFGKFKIEKVPKADNSKLKSSRKISENLSTSLSPTNSFINFQASPLRKNNASSSTSAKIQHPLSLSSSSINPNTSVSSRGPQSRQPQGSMLPNGFSKTTTFNLYKYSYTPDFEKSYAAASKQFFPLFDESEDQHRKRFNLFNVYFTSHVLFAESCPELFSCFVCMGACFIQRHDLIYPDKPKYQSLTRILNENYSFAVACINKRFNELLELSRNPVMDAQKQKKLTHSVFTTTMCAMLQFGATGFFRNVNYRMAVHFYYHYAEAVHIYKNLTKNLIIDIGIPEDGFAFMKELAYADIKEVFIPPYKSDFLFELFDDLIHFKRYIEYDPYMVQKYEQLISYYNFLNTEVLPLRNEDYVTKYPADIIYKAQNYWYRILAPEALTLNNNTNISIVQRIFYTFFATIGLSLESMMNCGGYLFGVGFCGFARINSPFEHTIFKELDGRTDPMGLDLKSHAIYLMRLISFFCIRCNIYFENIHFRNPYPDYLEQGYNRFRSRVLPSVREKQISSFKSVFIKRENFPSLSYSSDMKDDNASSPLFNEYEIQFKEKNPPINTRITSIIHNEEENSTSLIPFSKYSISRNGLLPQDFNPRQLPFVSNIDTSDFADRRRYVETFLAKLMEDRSILQSVTLYGPDNTFDGSYYYTVLSNMSDDLSDTRDQESLANSESRSPGVGTNSNHITSLANNLTLSSSLSTSSPTVAAVAAPAMAVADPSSAVPPIPPQPTFLQNSGVADYNTSVPQQTVNNSYNNAEYFHDVCSTPAPTYLPHLWSIKSLANSNSSNQNQVASHRNFNQDGANTSNTYTYNGEVPGSTRTYSSDNNHSANNNKSNNGAPTPTTSHQFQTQNEIFPGGMYPDTND